ncbi:extracellular solute-binding protein [Candidatus Aerophobetes bacterium]|uniref:Extracellular solute-binding protein n=1 Tax=Aerophobetes bacterium TaxID=2030807 RepID=A0A523RYU7_UNCAE|nr:MAG: extracellular solute-binding protein [Candidatus Aerophobetes bacterium]
MVKSRIKKVALGVLLGSLLLLLTGLPGVAKEIELRLLTSQVGVHGEAGWCADFVQAFNAEYAGRIKIVVDGVAEDSICQQKLLTDAAADTMPDLFMIGADVSKFNLLAQSGNVMPLNDYIKNDPVLKAKLAATDANTLAGYTDVNGNILGIPYTRPYIGTFYNTELFARAGIAGFPTTWNGFFTACDKLLAARITPIAMMTVGNAWCSMLLLSNMIGTSPEGMKWLATKPENQKLDVPVFIDAVRMLQTVLNKYTTIDAIGADYGVAANHFLQGNVAMIVNGPWMVASFSDPKSAPAGFEAKVKYALAPGNGLIATGGAGWGSGAKGEKRDAAVEALKFLLSQDVYGAYLSLTGQIPCAAVDISQVTYPRITQEFAPLAKAATYKYSYFSTAVKPAVTNALPQFLPGLADLSMSPEVFALKLELVNEAN